MDLYALNLAIGFQQRRAHVPSWCAYQEASLSFSTPS